jgi:hypothetical protein
VVGPLAAGGAPVSAALLVVGGVAARSFAAEGAPVSGAPFAAAGVAVGTLAAGGAPVLAGPLAAAGVAPSVLAAGAVVFGAVFRAARFVDLASYSAPAIELGDHPAAGETDVACDLPLKCRSEVRGRIISDSTETLPECVWGDEGPING